MVLPLSSCRRASDSHGAASRVEAARLTSTELSRESWAGVYASPAEVGGYTATVLVLDPDADDPCQLEYRMRFRSDVHLSGAIEQDEMWGSGLLEGDRIYIPQAHGMYREGKPWLHASVDRYTRRVVNGISVLLRDDALKVLDESDKLYDYGILIKVPRKETEPLYLERVTHPSVKLLYRDPSKEWQDPFVSGPNER